MKDGAVLPKADPFQLFPDGSFLPSAGDVS